MEDKKILDVVNLNVWYGNHHALKNINVSYEKNKIGAIIGPSGCGKSTFIRSINRINEEVPGTKVNGEILYNNSNIISKNVDPVLIRKQIGMVFQKPTTFPNFSIYENISIGLKLHGIKKKDQIDDIVKSSLTKAALWDEVKNKLNHPGTSLSGGQQQRLCIARSLALNPPILLMDEPTSALDPIATSKIEDLMSELKKEFTVIIVTHNMQQAARIADTTSFFVLGELIEHDESSVIFTNPKMKKTEDYINGRFG